MEITPAQPTPILELHIEAQTATVIERWRSASSFESSTLRRFTDLTTRFARRTAITGRTRLQDVDRSECEAYIWALARTTRHPALYTVHLRRTALRALFRTFNELAGTDHDPTREITLPPRKRRQLRPVTDDEIALLRLAAGQHRNHQRVCTVLALAEATATSGETPRVTSTDVDLDTGLVQLPGAPPIQSRAGQLTAWGRNAVGELDTADGSLTYRGQLGSHSHSGQAQISRILRSLLDAAGLDDPALRPSSIRLWQPARQLANGARLETVARMLGATSLDTTAALLGHDWQRR